MSTNETHHATIRVEDDRLLRGQGRFVDDDVGEARAFAYFVRSPHAFARIAQIDTAAAREAKGVLAVLTAADMKAAGVGNVSGHPPMTGRGGAKLVLPFRPALADGRVMHIGEAVAAVIATSQAAAQDAAEQVVVEYEEQTPIVDARAAVAAGAPDLWPEASGNTSLNWAGLAKDPDANAREADGVIKSAAHVAHLTHHNQRVFVASMETRGGTGSHDAKTGNYTLRTCSQSAGALRDGMLPVMGLKREQLRVITEDVGGAFGLKTGPYPELPVLLVAAKTTGRAVHWMSTRSEACLSDNQARDMLIEGELAIDDKGKFLALRIRNLVNLGAYVGAVAVHLATNNFARCFPGMYHIPLIDAQVRCVFTNTVPTAPYRGAGRPEANYILERLVDEAARITGIDRDKIRRRNLIPRSAIPYRTPVGTTYDSGDFPAVFAKAMETADFAGFSKRRREAAKRGKRRGLGISCLLEHSGGTPTESAALRFADGGLTVALGVHSTGQGHATVYKRLAAERLGIPAERVQVRQGDTALDVGNGASVGSRSTMTAGSALARAVDTLVEKGKKIAAQVLEAADQDIVYRDGAFAVTGTDRRIALFDLARQADELKTRGAIAENLDTKEQVDIPQTFPNGCHIAEVEVDPATGLTEVVTYTAVDDAGNIIDHTLIEGQMHGAVAQGLGQALLEAVVYDKDNGQLVSGSFLDYGMPRATDMPAAFTIGDIVVPATTNPLGVKGAGEAGTTAALAAVMNAIADAVPGAAHMDMPATPEKVWQA